MSKAIVEFLAKKVIEARKRKGNPCHGMIKSEVDNYNNGCIESNRWLTTDMVMGKIKRMKLLGDTIQGEVEEPEEDSVTTSDSVSASSLKTIGRPTGTTLRQQKYNEKAKQLFFDDVSRAYQAYRDDHAHCPGM